MFILNLICNSRNNKINQTESLQNKYIRQEKIVVMSIFKYNLFLEGFYNKEEYKRENHKVGKTKLRNRQYLQ